MVKDTPPAPRAEERRDADIPTAGSGPVGITMGPDGALWFIEEVGNKIGRLGQLISP